MKSIGTKTIETQRLLLRKFTFNDVDNVYNNWANDDEVTKFLTWPTHADVEVTKKVLKKWIDEYENNTTYQWCIELKENREAIGSIGIVNLNNSIDAVEFGYCIGYKYWKQGIIHEALAELVKFFFEEVEVNRIEARHDSNNPNSGKVMMKCGLKYEGKRIKADRNNTGICDVCLYGMTFDDYNMLLTKKINCKIYYLFE
jgi:ribosomal-protein-alanine N-acetyltransferase